jgi:AraC-like DNA-binding protein
MALSDDTRKRLSQAREMLAEVREHPLRIEDVAREVAISPFHFIRQFESVFGTTPHQFRTACRLHLAKRLLAQGRYSVTDVCMEVGFSSAGSFSALFTRRMGETPSAYQRRMRAMVQVPGRIPAALVPGCLSLLAQLPRGAFRNIREA